ncbi:Hypothetical protein FKW44_005884 [Caligus rogercresseyi]|uniref:Uncharacterized protein n=1 Tax=Caligus rogercresseyi TaxID=217165 RepID=A0A7T8KCK2_CALRO|nr:Hypothetical protein FKW44_005884 [Caligus rogercresseyi]
MVTPRIYRDDYDEELCIHSSIFCVLSASRQSPVLLEYSVTIRNKLSIAPSTSGHEDAATRSDVSSA